MKTNNNRILIVDDNPSIHEDIKQILQKDSSMEIDAERLELEEELFNNSENAVADPLLILNFDIDDAYQGEEAVSMVDQAEKEGRPYCLIFMDVRMPPGMDGIKTIHKIWERHPDIEMIICTAYSDYSWDQILETLGRSDSLFFMKKPFDPIALRQNALSLTEKWYNNRKYRKNVDALQNEIVQRTKDLSTMMLSLEALKTKAESAIVSKKGLLSSISRGILTPLSGIMGVTDMLLDTDLDADQRCLANTIKTSGELLLKIIDDVLDFSRAQNGTFDLEEFEFNVRTTVESISDLISANTLENGLDTTTIIHADIPETLIGDPLRLRQVLLILAINAVKFANSGEVLITAQRELSISPSELIRKSDKVIFLRFEISATGDGSPEKDHEDLSAFLPDSNAPMILDADDSKMDLALCKKLVQLMNGKTGIENEKGNGSTFWVTIPFKITDGAADRLLPIKASIKGCRCLILGDNPTSRKVLSLYINQWGGNCVEITSPESCVEQLYMSLYAVPFDVVIVDLKNGELDSYKDIADRIRRHKIFDNVRLICLTPKGKRGDAKILKGYGYSVYLTKPIRQSHLYNCLLMIKEFQECDADSEQDRIITKYFIDEISHDRYRLLVVEDNMINIHTIVRMLNKLTISCDVVKNGKQAVEAFLTRNYDMILMDCQMPEMNGFIATREIRRLEQQLVQSPWGLMAKPRTPILALTAEACADDRERCLEAGMDDFISKPVRTDKLMAILKRYLKPE